MLCSLFLCQTFFYFCLLLGAPDHAQLKMEIKKKWWDSRKHLNLRVVEEYLAIGSAVVHFAQVIEYCTISGNLNPDTIAPSPTATSATITWTQPEFSLPVAGYTVTVTHKSLEVVKYSVPRLWKRTNQQPPHPMSPPPHSLVFKSSAVTQSELLLISVLHLVCLH